MLQNETSGKEYHNATRHSYASVMIDPNYVNALTQPSLFKIYPKFYRKFPLKADNPSHSFIKLTSAITSEKVDKSGVYQLRVNPSAGALYPTEIYIQIRGIEGIIDGIYHLEVATNSLTLIYELIDDGLDSYIFSNYIIKGFIFLVSCVYFRASWKYHNRSIRYCFLDSGHHLGAIEASAYIHDRNIKIIFDFDKLALNEDLGFENKEFVTACVVSGEFQEKSIRRLRLKVPFVSGTDYFERNKFIEDGYKNTILPNSCEQKQENPQFEFDKERFLQTILQRRSARRFKKESILQDNLVYILKELEQAIPTESCEKIEIYSVVNRVEGMLNGLYKGTHLHFLKAGDFSEKVAYLCVNQAIVRDSAVTLFFVSDYTNYQNSLQLVGLLGHRIYLVSNYMEISCSGIGAYYDDETKEFLQTGKDILYAIVIGI